MYALVVKIFNPVRSYFINTTLHGFRFIAQPGRHWSERLLWTVLCILSWVGSAFLFLASWDAFQNNAVSFVVETTFLQSNTSFPSVSVCEDDNLGPVYEAANEMYGDSHDCNLDEIVRELTYFKGSAYYMKEFCSNGDLDCPQGNYSQIVKQVRSNCEDLLLSCSWRNVEFDCCKHFVKTETELGPCFTFGSRYERQFKLRGDPDFIETVSNRRLALPSLRIELNATVKIFLHTEADVPYLNTLMTDILQPVANQIRYFHITVTDIENPPELRELSISQRRCRFQDENNLVTSDYYSYSACVVDCRRRAQFEACGCTSHFTPKSNLEDQCGLKGILCLNQNQANLSVQKTKWGDKLGLVCDCLPGCSDPEYNVLSTSQEIIMPESNLSIVEIHLERFPTERYKRNVVRSRLDLVVSMGSAAGLFVGASLLSFVEIFYFFLLRTHSGEEPDNGGEDEEENKGPIKQNLIQEQGLPFLR
ncbi:hypothetical protein GE061_015732 [Apolygus lucorum]|uniref:Sodium channel protein Nach n=1 Tax=Apolygus lucorum TaxID=248454 RepID=A0A8S9XLZ0_APOLU|nr:hypothetical protein GE061_015732 [Apolygus lucorum]